MNIKDIKEFLELSLGLLLAIGSFIYFILFFGYDVFFFNLPYEQTYYGIGALLFLILGRGLGGNA